MIAILIVAALFLSLVFSVILKKPHIAILLVVLASSRSIDGYVVICGLGMTMLIQCLKVNFFNKDKTFWLIITLPIAYSLLVFVLRPYEIHFSYLASYLNAILMLILAASINWTKEKINSFTFAYITISIICGLLEFIFISPARVAGLYHFATLYAVVLVTFWTIWLTNTLFEEKSLIKISIVTFLVLLMVLLSGARMGLIGMVLGLFLAVGSRILIANFGKPLFTKIFIGLVFIICIFLLTIIVWQLIPEDLFIKRSFETILAMKLDKSNLGRVIAWVTAIDVIPKHILLGIGSGNFAPYAQKFLQNIGIFENFILPHAHNLFLIVLSEHGLIGFFVIGIIVFLCEYKLFFHIFRGSKNSVIYSLANGFIIVMFLGMFDATPLTLGTLCFGGWLMGASASFREKKC